LEDEKMKKYSKIVLGMCLAIGLIIALSGCASNASSQTKAKLPPREGDLSHIFIVYENSNFAKSLEKQDCYVLLNKKNSSMLAIINKTGTDEEIYSFYRQLVSLANAGEKEKQRLEELVNSLKVWVAIPFITSANGHPIYGIDDDPYNLSSDDILKDWQVFAYSFFHKNTNLNKSSLYDCFMNITNIDQLPIFNSVLKKDLEKLKK
jgi:hypothetical protein